MMKGLIVLLKTAVFLIVVRYDLYMVSALGHLRKEVHRAADEAADGELVEVDDHGVLFEGICVLLMNVVTLFVLLGM